MAKIKNLQNQDLYAFAKSIADRLKADNDLATYCSLAFSTPLTVVIGDDADLPGEEEAPYAFISGLAKSEGARPTQCQYEAYLTLGVKENVNGLRALSEFMEWVQNALNCCKSGCNPPATVESLILGRVGNSSDHWVGAIAAVWKIDLPLGGTFDFSE